MAGGIATCQHEAKFDKATNGLHVTHGAHLRELPGISVLKVSPLGMRNCVGIRTWTFKRVAGACASMIAMRQFAGWLFCLSGAFLGLLALGHGSASGLLWAGGAVLALAIGATLLPKKPHENSSAPGGNLHANERSRKRAVELAASGGIVGAFAQKWLHAHEQDPSIPGFGVGPYWTRQGPSGQPQLLSAMGLAGVEARLRYVREATREDSLLPIMCEDPDPTVREAARARLR